MKTLGVLAVLVGGLELANTVGAAIAGGRTGRSAAGVAMIAVTFAVSALLLVSGIALLVRGRAAISLARAAAFSCLVVFAALAALRPGFSVGSLLLGMAFPIVMLLFLRRRATHGSGLAEG
jgi:hypothetical protein